MRLLRRPTDTLEELLGDAISETLPKIVASVYDDDVDALFDMIADDAVDEFVRDALWRAAVTLTRQDRVAKDAMVAFIVRYDDERLAPAADMGWFGWLGAIAALGLQSLAPRADPLWTDGRLPEKSIERHEFEEDLAAGMNGEFVGFGAGTVDDIAADLAWADWDGPPEPYVNPMRNVGRNDPCPCGSGKKAKKCCLASG